jgi:hypothetical protein
MTPRLLAAAVLALAAQAAAAQTGPTLLTVFPPGAKAGSTVDVTVSGSNFDGDEQLLFSGGKLTAERVTEKVAVDPKAKQPGGGGRMATQQASGAVKFKVTVPEGMLKATVDVRVVSKSGLSNPRAFVIDPWTQVNEAEPNNDVPQAQHIELNTTVSGVISAPNDVDYVKFKATAGKNVVVYCLASSIDSRLHADLMVAGPDGKVLAANHGYRGGDAVLDFLPPADGEYVVRVAQYAYTTGGTDHFYRLTVTTASLIEAVFPPVGETQGHAGMWTAYGRGLEGKEKPDPRFTRPDGRPFDVSRFGTSTVRNDPPTRELYSDSPIPPTAGSLDGGAVGGTVMLEPIGRLVLDNDANGTAEKAQPITLPCDVAGRIARKNDRHWYSFDAKKGEVWTLEVFADRIGSPVDAYFLLTDAKGKTIVEVDDGADTLSPNQFYTKSDDPGRYRFNVPADGTYRVMVSTREAGVQFGVRDQYVLRVAKEKPDFRLAVMPLGPHYPDAATLPKNGGVLLSVFVYRFDGFDGPVTLTAADLPKGVSCPPQVVGPGQTRGTLVLTADADAADWAGFVTVKGKATVGGETRESAARPFTVTWLTPGTQVSQAPPNTPVLVRMDRGPGLALAVRGEAPFKLTVASDGPVKGTVGGKVELTVKVERKAGFKDVVSVYSGTPGIGPRQQGNNPLPPLATIAADKTEVKVSLDLPPTLPGGTHAVVVRGQAGAAPPKGNNNARVPTTYPAAPVAVEVEGKGVPPKKR